MRGELQNALKLFGTNSAVAASLRGELIEVYVGRNVFQNMTPTEAGIYHAKRKAERFAEDAHENERCWKEYRKMNH